MLTQGFQPVPVEHFGGLVTRWPAEMLDADLATEALNVRYTQAEVGSREGLRLLAQTPSAVRGVAQLTRDGGVAQAAAYGFDGYLRAESPAGSGNFQNVGAAGVNPCWMNAAQAYGRLYMGFTRNGLDGIASPSYWDGTELEPVTASPPAGAPNAQDSPSSGNVAAGLRWVVVLYRFLDGSLSAPSPPTSWTAAGGKEALIGSIATGPGANVAARVVAFTVAGGSQDGPYFYVPSSQTVNGVNETATVIEDNVTTSATFNFDDAFLAASVDVTDMFRAITLPFEAAVAYLPAVDRLAWWGEVSGASVSPSLVRFSEAADAGKYLGDTGFILVSPNDGEHVTAVFERRGTIYVAKESKLFELVPNDGDPATWQIVTVSERVGCCGPRAHAAGNDFDLLLHRDGIYMLAGGSPAPVSVPELLGPDKEHPGVWESILWSQAPFFWAHVDEDNKEARFGVAMGPGGGAGGPTHVLKVNYEDGWEPSLRFSAFTARYHYFPGRRWSLDTLAASQCVTLDRAIALDAAALDRRLGVHQIVFASSAAAGTLAYLDPAAAGDLGQPFESSWASGALSIVERMQMNHSGTQHVGLVQLRASGDGRSSLRLEIVTEGLAVPVAQFGLQEDPSADLCAMANVVGQAAGLRIVSDGAWRLKAAYAWSRPFAPIMPGAPLLAGGPQS